MKLLGLQATEVPDWLGALVALTRPLVVTALAAIPSIGALVVGTVAGFAPDRALAMAQASTTFLAGIPEAGWLVIAGVAGVYTGAKSYEVAKGSAAAAPAPIAPAPLPPVSIPAEIEEEEIMPRARAENPAGAVTATPTLVLE